VEAINVTAGAVVERILQSMLNDLEGHLKADVLFLNKPMFPPVDDEFRQVIEGLCADDGRVGADSVKDEKEIEPKRLVVLLETGGGAVEVVERIVQASRRHYDLVDFIVPNFAYSAGTILVLSGDNIYMDYYSVLGPIDPQFRAEDGQRVPGLGYLAKYNELIDKVNQASSAAEVKAELAYLTQKFDPAKLFHVEQAVAHSKTLLRQWLPKYKFKDWVVKESSGTEVNATDRERRAEEVAEILGNSERWHSHGRGISIRDLESEDIKLKITDFGEMTDLNRFVRQYYTLASDYLAKNGWSETIHSRHGFMGGR
jgi:hypothetical protein